jgi:hypothetical protein
VKLSGEYWNCHSVLGYRAAHSRTLGGRVKTGHFVDGQNRPFQ